MVDEYAFQQLLPDYHFQVQIPLWSMNTTVKPGSRIEVIRFRFLYGRWILSTNELIKEGKACSDSSMVDEYD